MILIIKHVLIEGPGLIGEFFQSGKQLMRTIELEKGDKFPDNFEKIKAIIVMGGPMNVDEEEQYPFLKEEDKFLKKVIALNIPLLGICLGAQLLAKAVGAKVRKGVAKEIGWYKVNLTGDGEKDLLFKGLGKSLEIFQWHNDQFDIPRDALWLAKSKICPNQAFKIGKNAYGLQFHMEITPAIVELWVKKYYLQSGKQSVKITDVQKMLIDTYRKKGQLTRQTKKILFNFSQMIEKESV
jgi:GMP synthase-like glutamine amidotransferase